MTVIGERTSSQSNKQVLDRPVVHVLHDRCAGCQECIVRCPTEALSLDPDNWIAKANQDLCVGCRQCQRTCPFSAIVIEGPMMTTQGLVPSDLFPEELLDSSHEVRQGFASLEEAQIEAARCIACPDPTCVRGCPTHNNIPEFIKAIVDGDLQHGREILSLTSCMPGACSRVCDWQTQCEGSCTWSLAGGRGVAVGRLERFIADNTEAIPLVPAADAGVSVAVVGAGPAGLGAAYELARSGAKVTVLEADAEAGGVMRWGIPAYVLPNSAWHPTVDALSAAGVDFRYSTKIETETWRSLYADFDGVVVSAGATAPIVPRIGGVELEGVIDASHFLDRGKAQLLGTPHGIELAGKKVLVLGAGNTAMDVARTVLRLGGTSICIDWMDERFSRARKDEIAEARHEGVQVDFCRTVTQLVGDENAKVHSAVICETSQSDALSIPKLDEAKTYSVDVDMVVLAMGYRIDPGWTKVSGDIKFGSLPTFTGVPDRRWLASGVYAGSPKLAQLASDRERVRLDSAFQVADRVWSIGDARIGPSTVVTAMAQGMSAARGVISQLGNKAPVSPENPAYIEAPAMQSAVLVYESNGGNTKAAAEAIAVELRRHGYSTQVLSTKMAHSGDIMAADLVVFGAWVEGLVVAKVHPAKNAMRFIESLPPLHGKTVASFVTFAVSYRGAKDELALAFVNKGASIVASAGISSKDILEGSKAFARTVARSLVTA